MNIILQLILVFSTILFFIFIINMVRTKKLELKYTLTWILTCLSFILIAIFPSIIKFISKLLHIIEPVNTLFLMIIFYLIVIVFTLTIALSRNSNRVKSLTQEVGILKLELIKIKGGIED